MSRSTGVRARRASAVALAAAFLAAGAGGSAGGEGPAVPRLAVAVYANGTCGPFADSLPALVTRTGIRTGVEVADTTVCATNEGRAAGGLHLRIAERFEADAACTGDEADVDRSCGGGGPGELGPALVQRIDVARCSRIGPPAELVLERPLPELESPVSVGDPLTPGHVVCVRLRLRYQPADGAALAGSQSDSIAWRYVFDLVSRP